MIQTQTIGYPRIGVQRELKKAVEKYWKKQIAAEALQKQARQLRETHWRTQRNHRIDCISSNDFSLYDQMLDMSVLFNCIPKRFQEIQEQEDELTLYFAMARGLQNDNHDVKALEMTKWFNTNYHYLIPEFRRDQEFSLNTTKIISEYQEAKALGIDTKPVLIGPVTYLILGKESEEGFNRLDLLPKLIAVYQQLITELENVGVSYIQMDEPIFSLTLETKTQQALQFAYQELATTCKQSKIVLTNYFGAYEDNLELACTLPVEVLHFDLVNGQKDLSFITDHPDKFQDKILSLGLVDGQNIWKNDFTSSKEIIRNVVHQYGEERIWIATSCSLLHSPYDLDLETNPQLEPIKSWLAFGKQKLAELHTLTHYDSREEKWIKAFVENEKIQQDRRTSALIHNAHVQQRVSAVAESDYHRKLPFAERQELQKKKLNLPFYPTTTIGSFPQTAEVRKQRRAFKNQTSSQETYDQFLREETEATIRFQEEAGLDVLVHGEYERNDMVEYFGEQLDGFAFTQNGWVQSYGSRCVKPPVIYGDVSRPEPMTIKWSSYAQSLTRRPVKAMLTGPVTILQWSFVRNDQTHEKTCTQIALAIRDEVRDLEKAGLSVIQIDEPALREGLPLREKDWKSYLQWSVAAFRLASSGVQDNTQIHTHMCYASFNDIIEDIARLDADVITLEASRSKMELLEAFADFKYPNEIGPGIYDIHSPRVPSIQEITVLLERAQQFIPVQNLWVNPDCGLKTRDWPETKEALIHMVAAAKKLRERITIEVESA